MAKKARVESSENDSECEDQHSSIDRISMLPDELLVLILSFLPLKEATATSIISRRWRYLWTFIPKLDFDGTEQILKVVVVGRLSELALDRERLEFIRRVNHVVGLHKGSTVEELRVYFDLTKTYQKDIDKWLQYALARKVQRLALNFPHDGSIRSRTYDECYTFPYELLCRDEANFSNCSQSWSMRQCNSIDFKYLKKMSMCYVNVSGEALEFFLRSCPLLEHLSVTQSGDLSTLKIIGPFPSFKCLEIDLCHNLNSVEIRDANIVCFKYHGSRVHFLLENLPLLVEISVGGMLTDCMEDVLMMLMRYLPQLEIFRIVKCHKFSWEETEMFYSAVKMSNLKQLVVEVLGISSDSLLPLTNLLSASPCLQRFVLESAHCGFNFVERKLKKIVRSYPNLKEIEFAGYRGLQNELELIMHLVDNAVALEKILVDSRGIGGHPPWEARFPHSDLAIIKDGMSARTLAKKQLQTREPPKIDLEII